jgi:hypothetical protein
MTDATVSIPQVQAKVTSESHASSLALWLHLVVFLASALIVISHRPDAILNPQFWAEDGRVFYAEAHNFGGWSVLFHPYGGYLNLVPRLAAAMVQIFPLVAAPLLFNLVAIFFQVLPINFFLSSRFASLASLRTRLLLSFLYLALPNDSELDANLTSIQWHLALLLCLVFMASPARSMWWRCFDLMVVVLGSLTGPFAILLLPLAGAAWWVWERRDRWTFALLAALATGALIQLLMLVRTGADARVPGALGASPLWLARILAPQVFLGALIAKNRLPYYPGFAVLIAIAGIAILLYALWSGSREIRLFIVFASTVLGASLLNPIAPAPKWAMLSIHFGIRYWFLPMLAFVASLVWMAGAQRPRSLRIAAAIILLLMPIGVVRDWRYLHFADLHFGDYARKYSDSPKGSSLVIPLNPPGWSMTLMKP